ncbi:sulfite exporter TauE/SafE family protein [Janibacter sp. YB324]|uniref:sulfite exporter TauE/SafE family protein n=1 Tax=Janibacter sp. YB324 TaxID=2761047 RepID=UPI0016243144|nr:sulfite exporter TauE/SafE family protein [Janibacter sp. YB324]QNF94129.1 sulfite exporter TauE/SafE family protein [Janibacter sp. YB324]
MSTAELLAVIPLGLAIGLTLGALGGGGSILAVPVLVHLLGQGPVAATTSSLIIVGITSVLSLPAHHRAGRVRLGQGLTFGLLGVLGAVAGSAASRAVEPDVLMTAFAVLMTVVAVLMLRRGARPEPDLGPHEPILTLNPVTCACPRLLKLVVAASLVGLLTGFLGVGGGFVVVPALVMVIGFPMPVAVGTSLLVIAVNSATSLVARFQHGAGELDWPLILGFAAAAVVGSLLGSRVADRIPAQRLSKAFAVLVLGVAALTAAQALPGLLA